MDIVEVQADEESTPIQVRSARLMENGTKDAGVRQVRFCWGVKSSRDKVTYCAVARSVRWSFREEEKAVLRGRIRDLYGELKAAVTRVVGLISWAENIEYTP